jgi:hypothetical protein
MRSYWWVGSQVYGRVSILSKSIRSDRQRIAKTCRCVNHFNFQAPVFNLAKERHKLLVPDRPSFVSRCPPTLDIGARLGKLGSSGQVLAVNIVRLPYQVNSLLEAGMCPHIVGDQAVCGESPEMEYVVLLGPNLLPHRLNAWVGEIAIGGKLACDPKPFT